MADPLPGVPVHPLVYRRGAELQDDALAFVLHHRHSGQIPRQVRSADTDIQFALGIERGCFKSCVARQRRHLAQALDKHYLLDALHPRLIPL